MLGGERDPDRLTLDELEGVALDPVGEDDAVLAHLGTQLQRPLRAEDGLLQRGAGRDRGEGLADEPRQTWLLRIGQGRRLGALAGDRAGPAGAAGAGRADHAGRRLALPRPALACPIAAR